MAENRARCVIQRLVDAVENSSKDLAQAVKEAKHYLQSIEPPAVYQQGRNARLRGQALDDCPYDSVAISSMWRAGWHDMDMEMGNKVLC